MYPRVVVYGQERHSLFIILIKLILLSAIEVIEMAGDSRGSG